MPSLIVQLAQWAAALRDVAVQGLTEAPSPRHAQNYQTVQAIADAMLALASGPAPQAIEPPADYPAPGCAALGAVIDDGGRILLIRRADNGWWTLPGGGLEAGETPAEGAVREVLEETGICCQPAALIGIFNVRPHAYNRFHLYLIAFLCRPTAAAPAAPSHAAEVVGWGWFAEDDLPEPVKQRRSRLIDEAFRVWRGDTRAYFDPLTPTEQSP